MIKEPTYSPLYKQIKNLMTGMLVKGEWLPGNLIPSEINLSQKFKVSQGTVRKAISELEKEHLLIRQQGKGTYVASHATEKSYFPYLSLRPISGKIVDVEAKLFNISIEIAPKRICEIIKLSENTKVFKLTRGLVINSINTIFEDIYVPTNKFEKLNKKIIDDYNCMLYSMYESEFKIKITSVGEKIRSLKADNRAYKFLNIQYGDPVLMVERVAYTYDEVPVELRLSNINTEKFFYKNKII